MNYLSIIVIFIAFAGLRSDFKKDAGKHKKAKAYHAVFVTTLLVFVAGFSKYLLWLMNDFNGAVSYIGKDLGIIPGQVLLISSITDIVLSAIVFFLAFRLIGRRKKEVKTLSFVLPLLALTSLLNFYRAFMEQVNGQEISQSFIFISGIILFGIPTFIIIRIYKKDFMNDFFNATN